MRVIRIGLRLATLVLTLSALVLIIAGSFWTIWQTAQGHAPKVGYEITATKMERAVIGLYLRYRGADVTQPANASDTTDVTFVVESGQAVGTVAWYLERQGLVTDGELFRRVVQYHGADGDIQAGVYTLRPSMTMEEIMRELQHGKMPSATITVVEGWRAEEIAMLLEEKGVVSAQEFMWAVAQGRSDFAFLRDRPASSLATVEGFLFPDTYQLPENTSAKHVLDIMLRNWEKRMPNELLEKAAEHDMTLYELMTLASVVEREAVRADERPMIASVYLNRFEIGMYMQSDPTVQYAKGYSEETGKWWNPMIQEEAITVTSPYNTFLNPGLPPSPICNPGLASIKAVLEPAETSYLFFYHKGDGSHAFAVTYEEHLANEQLYGGAGE